MSDWVEGDRIPDAKQFVEPDRLRAIGRVVGRLHVSAARFPIPANCELDTIDADFLFGDDTLYEIVPEEQLAVARSCARRVEESLRSLPRAPTTFGIIHADLEPQNWVFHEGHPRPIDFGEGALGFFLYDLLGVTWTHSAWPDYPDHRAALLLGYEEVLPIADDLRPHLDALQAASLFSWLQFVVSRGRPELREYVTATVDTISKLIDGPRRPPTST